ncbi:MAG: cyclic-di-AMP receptor [Clostridia bacterium]|nr:cyclic-di-AMP receptor [Clostridia bacterium]
MKLIIAIINSDDAKQVGNQLKKSGFYVTRLQTTGAFLQKGNVTLMTGVEDGKVDEFRNILTRFSSKRIVSVDSAFAFGEALAYSQPVDVVVGGATMFVLDVEQFHKI